MVDIHFRTATLEDVPALRALIAASARGLAAGDYSREQIEAALGSAWGVDTQLIRDGTYYAVESSGAGIIACGGWSYRQTLFGSDGQAGREAAVLDPATDAARIRAFFVRPDWARRGVGRALLDHCEAAARRAGFRSTALMATLPGVRLYQECGYAGEDSVDFPLPGGLRITFVPMGKVLA
jgi:GNAT superfamily N-acetyltransferase